jgi:hypothetical protein
VLTGPVPPDQSPFLIDLKSIDPQSILSEQLVAINSPDSSAELDGLRIPGTTPVEIATITATAFQSRTARTATIQIDHVH